MKKTTENKNKRKCKRKKNAKHGKRSFERGPQDPRHFYNQPPVPAQPWRTNLHTSSQSPFVPNLPHMKNSQNIWIKTYRNIVRWQFQHQLNYWKQCALQLREENARLRRRLAVQDSDDEDEELAAATAAYRREQQQRPVANDHDDAAVAGEEQQQEEDDDGALDEEFIAFMEVSARHRLERRRLKNESVH